MGRSVSHLKRAIEVAYFKWPKYERYNEETDEYEEGEDDYIEGKEVIEDITEYITELFPDFSICSRWDGNEDHIILEGYGTEIGLSEYCGLATLSIRVDESVFDYLETTEEVEQKQTEVLKFIEDNWEQISKYWNKYKRMGGLSDGTSVYKEIEK